MRFLVLDEADEMLNMGFAEDVETILADTPSDKQVALFSATMPKQIKTLSQKYLNDPVEIAIERKTRTAENIRQRYLIVSLPAEGRRADPDPRGRELRGRDRLRAHQERDRDARREACAPAATAPPRSTATSCRPSASAPSTRLKDGKARHPGGHRRRGPRHRRPPHQPRLQLRHPHRHRGLRAPHRPHRPRRPQR
nr:DEAD/DEAH box helicase [Nocardioides convexus]